MCFLWFLVEWHSGIWRSLAPITESRFFRKLRGSDPELQASFVHLLKGGEDAPEYRMSKDDQRRDDSFRSMIAHFQNYIQKKNEL